MPFCSYSNDMFRNNYTAVDNRFFAEYMLDSPKNCLEAYLFGLYLCGNPDKSSNTLEIFTKALKMTEDDVLDAFTYWEELGLVQILQKNPLEIYYLPITETGNLLKKIKPGKYKDFNKGMESILTDRLITPNEFNEYHLFLESSFFQPEALLLVAKYCADLKGNDIGYKYILTVARNLNNAGYKTLDAVEEKLTSHPLYNEETQTLLRTMGIRRSMDYSDRETYEKWKEHFGFQTDVILHVAKKNKKYGLQKLDKLLENYFRLNLFDIREIDEYEANKTKLYDLSKSINKIIGVYYQSLDFIVEDYITPWLQLGFSAETLETIAKYCFKHSVRTLEGMNEVIEKFYKKGLVTLSGINQYLDESIAVDKKIREIIDKMGLLRNITTADRTNYRVWTQNWGFEQEMLLYVASLSQGAQNPTAYFTKILSQFKEQHVFTPEQAKRSTTPKKEKAEPVSRNYTKEQLDALFDNLNEFED